MSKSLALFALTAGILATTAASAQNQMYPGQGITVNGQAASMGAYGPNGPYPGVIHLHMPAPKKRHVVKKAAPSTADVSSALMAAQPPAPKESSAMPDVSGSAPDMTASAPPAPKPKKTKKTETPPPAPAADETNSGLDGGLPLSLAPEEQHPVAAPKAKTPQKTASIAPAPSTTANVVAAPQTPGVKSNLSKRTEILFPRGATDPGTATINKLRSVASELNTLLGAGAQRVQLEAYGGTPGDKSSDARRLSLKRALVIRQILIEDGVPGERIDVRAMGGIDDHGAPDRVDVFVDAS
ncbi:MAG TPA: OmpA family protein [Rhizomicrobium sp.]|jgi:outer membrane protein OmpA-like peptidoglycan-associated protein